MYVRDPQNKEHVQITQLRCDTAWLAPLPTASSARLNNSWRTLVKFPKAFKTLDEKNNKKVNFSMLFLSAAASLKFLAHMNSAFPEACMYMVKGKDMHMTI